MSDVVRDLMLDGNSVGGLLAEVFGRDMTDCPCRCAQCGAVGAVATLLAFTRAPGVVLRCPFCEAVVLRMVKADDVLYLDARGATYFKLTPTGHRGAG
jgi:hypothetical protein